MFSSSQSPHKAWITVYLTAEEPVLLKMAHWNKSLCLDVTNYHQCRLTLVFYWKQMKPVILEIDSILLCAQSPEIDADTAKLSNSHFSRFFLSMLSMPVHILFIVPMYTTFCHVLNSHIICGYQCLGLNINFCMWLFLPGTKYIENHNMILSCYEFSVNFYLTTQVWR